MLTDGCVQSIVYFDMSFEIAILETLAYSDIFDYPLTADELHRFLGVSASRQDIESCAAGMKAVSLKDGYYFLGLGVAGIGYIASGTGNEKKKRPCISE